MAVADATQVRRTRSLWTLPDEHVRPDTKDPIRREPGGRFQSRIEGIIAGLEELKILREMHARLVQEATMAAKKKTKSDPCKNDDKAKRGPDNDESAASPGENSSNDADDVEASPSSGPARTNNVAGERTQDCDDKYVEHIQESAALQIGNRLQDDYNTNAMTPTTVVFRKCLGVPEKAEISNRKQRWRHSDGHLIADADIVTQVGMLLKQPRQLCVSGSTFHFPSPMHAVMLQYQGLSTPVNVYADPSFDITSSWFASGQRCEIPKQLRRSVSNAAIMQPRPLKTPQRSSSLFIPQGRMAKFNFNRRATTSFNSVSVSTKLDADNRTLREQCGTPTDCDESLVRSCSDASSCSHECSHLKVVFDDGKVACVHSDSVSRQNVTHTGSLRSDVSYGSTGSSHPDASSSDEDKVSLSPDSNVFADNEERTTFAWDFISCSLESFAEMRDTDV